MVTEIEEKDKELGKLSDLKKNLKNEIKEKKKEYQMYVSESDTKFRALNKSLRTKDKEVHDMNKKLEKLPWQGIYLEVRIIISKNWRIKI